MFDNVPITPGSTKACARCATAGRCSTCPTNSTSSCRIPGLRFFGVGVSERNKLNLPTYEFIVDGTETIVTPDPVHCLTDPLDPSEFPPELFGPGGPLPLTIACNLFKTPALWGSSRRRPISTTTRRKRSKRWRSNNIHVQTVAGIILTPQDEADIVAFLKLL